MAAKNTTPAPQHPVYAALAKHVAAVQFYTTGAVGQLAPAKQTGRKITLAANVTLANGVVYRGLYAANGTQTCNVPALWAGNKAGLLARATGGGNIAVTGGTPAIAGAVQAWLQFCLAIGGQYGTAGGWATGQGTNPAQPLAGPNAWRVCLPFGTLYAHLGHAGLVPTVPHLGPCPKGGTVWGGPVPAAWVNTRNGHTLALAAPLAPVANG